MMYQGRDVTVALRAGANALGLLLGDSFYSPQFAASPLVKLVLRVTYGDGENQYITSNTGQADAQGV
jgi:hypothetical protein